MKNLFNLATTASLILALAIFISCGGGGDDPDPAPDPCETNSGFLTSGSASVTSVTNPNGTNVTSDWTGFSVTFSGSEAGGSFTTNVSTLADASLANIWPASGTWVFDASDTTCKTLILSATGLTDRSAAISISANTVEFTFNVPEADTGRTTGIPGIWSFIANFVN